MKFISTNIDGLYEIELDVYKDNRGWFARTYCKEDFNVIHHNKEWIQINHSFTRRKGSIRGMHYQVPPYHEAKLVRCIAGAIFDVAIDLRKKSPTFMNWVGIELSADNKKMFYIPEGCAHGFQTLTDNTELIYNHTSYYNRDSESGLRYDEPIFAISWPLPISEISEKDLNHPFININFQGILL